MRAPERTPAGIHWVYGAERSSGMIPLDDKGELNKGTILHSLAQHFAFPAYFGGNWDAAYDLLLDQVDALHGGHTVWQFVIANDALVNQADLDAWLQLMADVGDYALSRDAQLQIEVHIGSALHAIDDLLASEDLPEHYRHIIDTCWQPLAQQLRDWQSAAGRTLIVGINGAQGSGKTTLCSVLDKLLLPQLGLRAVTLSLDDLYLPRAERERLEREVHPLLVTRGVPGTHDVALGLQLLDALSKSAGTVTLPRFSKASDDRLPTANWPQKSCPVDIVLFEGWCVGAAPQAAEELTKPVNTLEEAEDTDGRWRRWVNDQLAGPYAQLFARLDKLVMLRIDDWSQVLAARQRQEDKLRARNAGTALMDRAQLERFIAHYERLTRHQLRSLPARADALFAVHAGNSVNETHHRQ